MSASTRATSLPEQARRRLAGRAATALYRGSSAEAKVRPKLRAARRGAAPAALDLAARIRTAHRTLRSRIERREALIDIVRAVNATLEPKEIAEFVVERARAWVPAPAWALVSGDLSGQLSVLADDGLEPDMGPAIYSIAEWVVRHGQEFTSGNLAHDSRAGGPLPASAVAFPLTCRGRQLGVLIGLDRHPSTREPRFAPVVVRALRVLLEPASAALDNALLLKRAEALSVTDDLTRLYNSRYLNLVLRRETKRASRSGRPLSLLFIDLDGFKAVNDSHGHLCGSRALVEAAAVIRSSARETDVVARFGGDEFALVLPDTGSEGAIAVGERIRERIAAHAFLSGSGLHLHLTASVGVATLPDVAASADELVHAADAAMYQVKDRGKNGIQAATPPTDN